MKVLFLDIDGVLNSTRSAAAFRGYPHDFSPVSKNRFDPVALKLLKRVVDETGAVVVMSSSWRNGFPLNDFQDAFDVDVVDKTPSHYGLEYEGRGKEIQAWLNANSEKLGVTAYAIVDDDTDMLDSQKEFFVETDPLVGLTYSNYLKLVKILGPVEQ